MSTRVLLLHQRIHDADALARYRAQAHDLVEHFGGRVRARPDAIHALEGSAPALAICIEFPDVDTARRWYGSPEYGAARLLREGASEAQLLLIDEQ